MVAGHFGLAAGVKGVERHAPLWALMLATAWLDVLFGPLYAAGIETLDPIPGTNGGYGSQAAIGRAHLLGVLVFVGGVGVLGLDLFLAT